MENEIRKKIMLSGIQPSGDLHLGNYLGAVKNWGTESGETSALLPQYGEEGNLGRDQEETEIGRIRLSNREDKSHRPIGKPYAAYCIP